MDKKFMPGWHSHGETPSVRIIYYCVTDGPQVNIVRLICCFRNKVRERERERGDLTMVRGAQARDDSASFIF